MPKPFDPGDTRYLAERTRDAQREQHRITKAVAAVQGFASLPVGKRANVRKTACFGRDGLMFGLIESAKLLPVGFVNKAKDGPTLRVAYDSTGTVIGVVDQTHIEQLADGESFVYDESGTPCGILGSDGRVRPVQGDASAMSETADADRDAAAWVAATAPATAPGSPMAAPVAKAKRPAPTWAEATAQLRKLRLTLARERVAKAQAMDTRNIGPRDEVIRLLDQLEPVLKMAAPPPPDAERYLRKLGMAANAMLVRKSGNHDKNVDLMVAAALIYKAMPPAQQTEVRKALARTSAESRIRAKRALRIAMADALDPVGELRITAKGRKG